MVNKKVTCYSVNIPESMDFVQLLLDNEESSLKPFVLDQYRTIELKYTQIQKNGSIVGLFVTTSRKNIPPAHKPGNGDDYTALPLDDGQGLAYPNVFLYDPQFKVLYLETNRMVVSPSKICAYFEARAIRDSIPTFWIEISPLLKKEAYERVENMVRIKYVNLKLAKPTGLLRNNLSKGSLRGLASISDQLNADKYMQCSFTADKVKSLKKGEILNIIDSFGRIHSEATELGREKGNKLIIKGNILDEDGAEIEDVVDFLLNKIDFRFSIEEPIIASNLQFMDRKNGINTVYMKLYKEVSTVVDSIQRLRKE